MSAAGNGLGAVARMLAATSTDDAQITRALATLLKLHAELVDTIARVRWRNDARWSRGGRVRQPAVRRSRGRLAGVAEAHGGGDLVDADVGRAECGPEVVTVPAQLVSGVAGCP